MEEMKALVERIKTNHDDLDAWQRVGELVDDPQKKRDCLNQVTRIQNERYGVFYSIPCKQCGAFMQVVSANDGQPGTTACPACYQAVVVERIEQPAVEISRTGSRSKDGSRETVQLKSQLTLFVIIVSNLLPIFGILFFGWSMGSVMVLYWFENVIVGLFALLKMAFAQGQTGTGMGRMSRISSFRISFIPSSTANTLSKLTILPFFCVHFGLFCLAHGVFVVALFLPKDLTSGQWMNLLAGLTVPLLGMLVSHGIYFVQHYLRSGTYKFASVNALMLEPYARIAPMHVGLIAAGFFIVTFGSPMVVVVILVLLKTGAEVVAYRNSMKRWRPQVS
jgi:hypothetical protein